MKQLINHSLHVWPARILASVASCFTSASTVRIHFLDRHACEKKHIHYRLPVVCPSVVSFCFAVPLLCFVLLLCWFCGPGASAVLVPGLVCACVLFVVFSVSLPSLSLLVFVCPSSSTHNYLLGKTRLQWVFCR